MPVRVIKLQCVFVEHHSGGLCNLGNAELASFRMDLLLRNFIHHFLEGAFCSPKILSLCPVFAFQLTVEVANRFVDIMKSSPHLPAQPAVNQPGYRVTVVQVGTGKVGNDFLLCIRDRQFLSYFLVVSNLLVNGRPVCGVFCVKTFCGSCAFSIEKAPQNSPPVRFIALCGFHAVRNFMQSGFHHRLPYRVIPVPHSVPVQIHNAVLILAANHRWIAKVFQLNLQPKLSGKRADSHKAFRGIYVAVYKLVVLHLFPECQHLLLLGLALFAFIAVGVQEAVDGFGVLILAGLP